MRRLLLLGWKNRYRTALLALAAIIVSIAPALTLNGWVYLAGAVGLLVGSVLVWDALDLRTAWRDHMAWRRDREGMEARLEARRRHRENLRLLR